MGSGRRAVVAAAAVALVAVVVAIEGRAATFPGGNGRIAVVRFAEARPESDLVTIAPDGAGAEANLTADVPGYAWAPAWSADGSRIAFFVDPSGTAFSSGFGGAPRWSLVVAQADGAGKRTVKTFTGGTPTVAWSPDGTRLVYERRGQLFMIAPDGSGETQIRDFGPDAAGDPSWSPDGSRIAFPLYVARRESTYLYVMNADGSGLRRVTTTEAYSADWSPDGRRFVFEGPSGIQVVEADGSGERRVFGDRVHSDSDPRWSPDGRRIVFVSDRWSPDDIAVMNADGSCARRFTRGSLAAWQPIPGGAPSDPISCADVSLHARATERLPRTNRPFVLAVSLRNRGNLTAEGVRLRIRLNDPERPRRTEPRSPGCSGTRLVVCTVGSLGPGEQRRLAIRLVPRESGYTYLTADVEAANAHPDAPAERAHAYFTICSHKGTPGDDVFVGSKRADTFCLFGGDDRIRAGGGTDLVYAGPGDDVVDAGPGPDGIGAGPGNDRVHGGSGADVVLAGAGIDVVNGGAGEDSVDGQGGDDRLLGGPGYDELLAGRGHDAVFGGPGRDSLDLWDGRRDYGDGGPGRDEVSADRHDRIRSARRGDFALGSPGLLP